MGISAYRLAVELHVSAPTVNDIVHEKRGITTEMAARLARYFGTSEQFWLNLQDAFALHQVRRDIAGSLRRFGQSVQAREVWRPLKRDIELRSTDSRGRLSQHGRLFEPGYWVLPRKARTWIASVNLVFCAIAKEIPLCLQPTIRSRNRSPSRKR